MDEEDDVYGEFQRLIDEEILRYDKILPQACLLSGVIRTVNKNGNMYDLHSLFLSPSTPMELEHGWKVHATIYQNVEVEDLDEATKGEVLSHGFAAEFGAAYPDEIGGESGTRKCQCPLESLMSQGCTCGGE